MKTLDFLSMETMKINIRNNVPSSPTLASILFMSGDYRYDHYVCDCLDDHTCLVLYLLFE
jgi:hypothetical protein